MIKKFFDLAKMGNLNRILRRARIKKMEIKGMFHFLNHDYRPESSHPKAYFPDTDTDDAVQEKNIKKTIKDIRRHKCIGCGLCYAVCKSGAIEMTRDDIGFIPQFDEQACNHCGLCYRVCPGINVAHYPRPLGEIKKMIVGHACDPAIRYEASSGGICRSILTGLLEKKIVDKVIVTRATDDPYHPETIITSSINDLSGNRINSIYSPTSPLAVLKNMDKNLRYAFVGLPCHIVGLSQSPFKKRIHVTIGIFCSHTPSFKFVRKYLKDLSSKDDVQSLRYRGDGWPGKSKIYFKNHDICDMFFPAMWHTYNYKKTYQQPRCSLCTYYSAEFADISIGDPWILARKDRQGSSLVFMRNDRGIEVIDAIKDRIDFEEVSDKMKEPILKFHVDSVNVKQKQK